MLVSYSAYERVAINTAAESLGFITSLVRLFCRLKVSPPVCFVCRAAAKPPILSPVHVLCVQFVWAFRYGLACHLFIILHTPNYSHLLSTVILFMDNLNTRSSFLFTILVTMIIN